MYIDGKLTKPFKILIALPDGTFWAFGRGKWHRVKITSVKF